MDQSILYNSRYADKPVSKEIILDISVKFLSITWVYRHKSSRPNCISTCRSKIYLNFLLYLKYSNGELERIKLCNSSQIFSKSYHRHTISYALKRLLLLIYLFILIYFCLLKIIFLMIFKQLCALFYSLSFSVFVFYLT